VAAPVVSVISDAIALAPSAAAATLALQVFPPTVQLCAAALQGKGALQLAFVAAPQAPLVQAKVAAPVVGAAVSDSTALAPEAVDAAAASQVLPPTVQLKAEAAHATGAVQETLVAAPHTPFVHAKLAAPVVGAVVSDNAAVAPEAVDAAVALHTLAPTLQLKAPEHGAAVTGTAQVAEVAAPQTPLVQAKVAAPVVGAAVSDNTALAPDAVAADVALHVLPPTVQLKALAVQPTGAVHVAPVAAPHTPLLQAKVAAPVVGAAVSDSTALAPEAVDAAAASQVLPPTVQLKAEAAHATGAVQETLVAAPHTPFVHAKLAAPVVGAVVSDNAAVAPDAVAGAVALHVLAPTVQLKAPVAQAEGEVHVALVAAPHTPLVHVKLAEPVVGAVTSVSAAVEPEVVTTSAELQVLPPTVQLAACATQSVDGATIALP
jgi:trimeric autotransporter adhesin